MEGFSEQHSLSQKAWSFNVGDVSGIISKDKGCECWTLQFTHCWIETLFGELWIWKPQNSEISMEMSLFFLHAAGTHTFLNSFSACKLTIYPEATYFPLPAQFMTWFHKFSLVEIFNVMYKSVSSRHYFNQSHNSYDTIFFAYRLMLQQYKIQLHCSATRLVNERITLLLLTRAYYLCTYTLFYA